MMKVILITNNPAPYRVPVFNILASMPGLDFQVLYCSEREPDRRWSLPELEHKHRYLDSYAGVFSLRGKFIHWNKGVNKLLKKKMPDVVITCGFSPTMLLGWLFCQRNNVRHISMSDGTRLSESDLSFVHRYVRKVVFRTTSAFIGASKQTLSMYSDYDIPADTFFQSHLCVDNASFVSPKLEKRTYDIMFSGRFIDSKMPLFFCEIVNRLLKGRKQLSVLILGSGPGEEKMRSYLSNSPGLLVNFAGYVAQSDLPKYYGDTKLLLFPTRSDAWGVVANEACASGVPVITCKNAGVAGELVVDGVNGFVLPLDEQKWVSAIDKLLDAPEDWLEMSTNALEEVEKYNFDAAANGISEACRLSLNS